MVAGDIILGPTVVLGATLTAEPLPGAPVVVVVVVLVVVVVGEEVGAEVISVGAPVVLCSVILATFVASPA